VTLQVVPRLAAGIIWLVVIVPAALRQRHGPPQPGSSAAVPQSPTTQAYWRNIGTGIVFGTLFGLLIGTLLGNAMRGVVFGMMLGAVVGAILEGQSAARRDPSSNATP
jgi:hypothetical protein